MWKNYDSDDNYRIEGDKLLTDSDTAEITYISRADVSLFSSEFTASLSARIAAHLAYAETGSRTIKVDMEQLFRDRFNYAKGVNAQGGGKPPVVKQDEWMGSRSSGNQDFITLADYDGASI